MNGNLLLENDASRSFGRLMLGIFGITVAVGGLFVGGQMCGEWQQQRKLAENNEQLVERLAKLGQYYNMVHQLGEGNSDILRQQYCTAMAQEISEIRSTLGGASEEHKGFAEHVCSLIAQDQKDHPAYYQIGQNVADQQSAADYAKHTRQRKRQK